MDTPRGSLATLFVIVFTDLVGFGIVIPLVPLYAEHFHPSPWQFGVLMAAYSAMQLVFAPVLGAVSDRVGRRPVLLISLLGSVAGYVLFAVAGSLAGLLISRVVAGIAGANIATAQAVIADLTPVERRARGMGLIGAAFGLGFIAGPALASGLLLISPMAPGFGAATCSALAFAMTLVLLPESLPSRSEGAVQPAPRPIRWGLARLAVAKRFPGLPRLLVVGFLLVAGFAAFEVTFAQLLHARLDLPKEKVTLLFVYIGVLAAAVQGGLMGRLSRRYRERHLLLAGLLLVACGLGGLSLQHTLPGFLAVMPLVALGSGLANPSLSALVSKGVGAQEQGEALGAFQGIGSLARVVGPFVGEIGFGRLGPGAPTMGAAAAALLAAASIVLARKGAPDTTSLSSAEH
jgi:MFS transporter, DHA1 family, tetracycline resistance protein